MSIEIQKPDIGIEPWVGRKVRDAVIAAAGYGTRFLPFTTNISKELLPLGRIPVIQRLVDECIDAGLENIYVMTRPESTIVYDHFRGNSVYSEYLNNTGKKEFLSFVEGDSRYSSINFLPVNPRFPYGNAQGILTIQEKLKILPNFLLLWGDDIVLGRESSIREIIRQYEQNDCDAVVGVQRTSPEAMKAFGNIKLDPNHPERVIDIVTKPKTSQELVSEYAVFGQMVLPGNIFDYLNMDNIEGEPDVTGIALKNLAKVGRVLKSEVSGRWVTIGDPENYLKAMVIWYALNGGDRKKLLNIFDEIEDGI